MEKSNRFRFTEKAIDALPLPFGDARALYYDDNDGTQKLALRVYSTGRKVFCIVKFHEGKAVKKNVGIYGEMSVAAARRKAKDMLETVSTWDGAGVSPFAKPTDALTLQTALDDYCEGHLKPHAKNPTRAVYDAKWNFKKYVPASLSGRPLAEISKADIRQLHQKIGTEHGQFVANRLVDLLRALYNYHIRQESYDGANPAASVTKFHEASRNVYLAKNELPKFLAALAKEKKDNRDLHDIVWLALLTGARRGDLLAMRWQDLNLDAALWNIPNPKSRTAYVVALAPEAVEVIKSRRGLCADSVFVFPGDGATGHWQEIKKSWEQFRADAGFPNLRFHDLRRTMASHAVQNNVPLLVVAKMLGHASSAAVTEVYARLSTDTIREGVGAATKAIVAAAPKG